MKMNFMKKKSIVGASREGRAGGYKEFDDEEIKETRKRRKEAEEVRRLCPHFGVHTSCDVYYLVYFSDKVGDGDDDDILR